MYTPTDKSIWTGRIDTNEGELGLRWHQKIQCIDLSFNQLPELIGNEKGIVFIGFESDEGVRRNQGRTGAKEGPDVLRNACCNHANHFHEKTMLFDAGNVTCQNEDLEGAQYELQQYVKMIRSSGYFPFVFGGGHEVAYPHFMGLDNATSKNKTIGIINIDAHFDLRIPDDKPSSGTPFYQIAKHCTTEKQPFNYLCLGIQESSNTQALFKRAEELGVTYILAHDCQFDHLDNIKAKIHEFIMKVDAIYLTTCLDVFDISVAPGVSAPSTLGLRPEIAVYFMREIVKSGKLIATDIAELNPSLDQNNMTAKLAAKLVYEIITAYQP